MLHNGPAVLQNVPVILIFVVVWLILKLIDYAENFQTGWTIYTILRFVAVLVGLILIVV